MGVVLVGVVLILDSTAGGGRDSLLDIRENTAVSLL